MSGVELCLCVALPLAVIVAIACVVAKHVGPAFAAVVIARLDERWAAEDWYREHEEEED